MEVYRRLNEKLSGRKGLARLIIAVRDQPLSGLGFNLARRIGDERLHFPVSRRQTALGELELRRGGCVAARQHFEAALSLARNPTERRFFSQRIAACGG